jgi:hypothetical protein
MLLDTQRKHLQFIAVVGFADVLDRPVTHTICVLADAESQHTWFGAVLEIFVDIQQAACAQAVVAEAHLFAQQEHQHIAVSYSAHSAQHVYQVITAVLYVIIAQAAMLVAATAAISTVAEALAMWHSKVVYLHAHAKQKFI